MALHHTLLSARQSVIRQPSVLSATKESWRAYAEAPGDPKKIVAVLYKCASEA